MRVATDRNRLAEENATLQAASLRPGLLAVIDMIVDMEQQATDVLGEEESWVQRGANAARNDLLRRIERRLAEGG